MKYEVSFDDRALKEWKKLSKDIQEQFRKKIKKIQINPKIESIKLRELKDCYKIKLRSSGYRLIYQIKDNELIILILAVGKRERSQAYKEAEKRI